MELSLAAWKVLCRYLGILDAGAWLQMVMNFDTQYGLKGFLGDNFKKMIFHFFQRT